MELISSLHKMTLQFLKYLYIFLLCFVIFYNVEIFFQCGMFRDSFEENVAVLNLWNAKSTQAKMVT